MHTISGTTGSVSDSKASWQDGYTGRDSQIDLARSVSLLEIFRAYDVEITEYNRKCICPLHQENTASFYYYKDTNSFYCFGCQKSGGPIEFVSGIEGISKEIATKKLLSDFEPNPDFSKKVPSDVFEKQKLFLTFSGIIREFILEHKNEEGAFEYADNICKEFDKINNKHKDKINIIGIKYIIDELKEKLYRWQQL